MLYYGKSILVLSCATLFIPRLLMRNKWLSCVMAIAVSFSKDYWRQGVSFEISLVVLGCHSFLSYCLIWCNYYWWLKQKQRWLMQIWQSMGRHSTVNVLRVASWFQYRLICTHSHCTQLNVFLMFLCGTKIRRDTIPLSVNIHNYNVRTKMWNLSQHTHLPKIWDLKHSSTSQFQTVQWPTLYLWVLGPVNFLLSL